MNVTIDLAAGEVRMDGFVLRDVSDASAISPGALRVAGVGVFRPLGFVARSSLCLHYPTPAALGRGILEATVDGTAASALELELLALHLAGAQTDRELPGFAETAYLMGRVFGWTPEQLGTSSARWIDELAVSAVPSDEPTPVDGGWTRLRLDGGDGLGGDEAARLRDRLCAALLARARAPLAAAFGVAVPAADAVGIEPPRRFDPAVAMSDDTRAHACAVDAAAPQSVPADMLLAGREREPRSTPPPAIGGDARGSRPASGVDAAVGLPHPGLAVVPTRGPVEPWLAVVAHAAEATPPWSSRRRGSAPKPASPDGALPRFAGYIARTLEPWPRAMAADRLDGGRPATLDRTGRSAERPAEAPVRLASFDLHALGDRLAAALDEEADRRGMLRW